MHGHCSCPECGTILRIRDRSFVGRQIQCPECHTQLEIKLDDDREFVAVKAKAEPKAAKSKRVSIPTSVFPSALSQRISNLVRSPLFTAWALAIGIMSFLAIVMLRPAVRFQNPESTASSIATTRETESAKGMESALDPSKIDPQVSTEVNVSVGSEASSASIDPVPVSKAAITTETHAESVAGKNEPQEKNAVRAPTIPMPAEVSTNEKPHQDANPVIAPPPGMDMKERLVQKIGRYSTGQSLSRARLIEHIEEMLGPEVRIHYDPDELGRKNLETTLSVSLENTTVGAIFQFVLEDTGWEYSIEGTAIRLKPRQIARPNP